MPTAKINLTVTQFRDINTTPDTPRWTSAAAPVITDNAGGKVSIDPADPNVIVVQGPAAIDLQFTILPAGFLPAGVIYKQIAGASDPKGKKNFNLGGLAGNTITIQDKMVDKGTQRWEFFVTIQDSTGAIGIIDPDIENEN
jgi:hypothetical protein